MIATALPEKRELPIDQSNFYRESLFEFEDEIHRNRSSYHNLFSYANESRIQRIASLNGELPYNKKIELNQDFKEIIRNTILEKSGFQKALYKSKLFNESKFTNHDFKRYADILRIQIINGLDLNDVEKNRIDYNLRQITADAIKYRNKYINSQEDSQEKRILHELYQIENKSPEEITVGPNIKIQSKIFPQEKSDYYYFENKFPALLKNQVFTTKKSLENIVEENTNRFFIKTKKSFEEILNHLHIISSNTKNLYKKIESNICRKISSHLSPSLKILNSRWKLKKEDLIFSFNNFSRELIESMLNKLNRGFGYASLITFLITSLTTTNKPVETVIVNPYNYFETFYPQHIDQLKSPNLSNEEKQLIMDEAIASKNLTKETSIHEVPTDIPKVKTISTKTKHTAKEKVRTYLKTLPTNYLLDNPTEADRIYLILVNADPYLPDLDLISQTGLTLVESGGNPNAVSPDGAAGLAQLMPKTAREELNLKVPKYPTRINGTLYTSKNPIKNSKIDKRFDPRKNIEASIKYRSELKKRFKGNLELELASYNAGPTLVEDCKCIPENGETPNFVSMVKLNIKEIKNIYEQLGKEDNLENYLEGIAEGTIEPPVFDYSSSNSSLVRLILASQLGEEWFDRHYGSFNESTLDIIYKFIKRNNGNKVKTLIERNSSGFNDSLSKRGRVVFLAKYLDIVTLQHIEGLSLGLNDEGEQLILIPKYELDGLTGEIKTFEELERNNYYMLSVLHLTNTDRKELAQNNTNLTLN